MISTDFSGCRKAPSLSNGFLDHGPLWKYKKPCKVTDTGSFLMFLFISDKWGSPSTKTRGKYILYNKMQWENSAVRPLCILHALCQSPAGFWRSLGMTADYQIRKIIPQEQTAALEGGLLAIIHNWGPSPQNLSSPISTSKLPEIPNQKLEKVEESVKYYNLNHFHGHCFS